MTAHIHLLDVRRLDRDVHRPRRLAALPGPAAAFVAAHTAGPGAWAAGTAKKYRETFAALGAKLIGPPAAGLAALDAEAGRAALAQAFDAAFSELAPATYARHLSALRSAVTWWRASGWLKTDPTAGWARPKIPVDTTRALTREQIDALFRLDAPIRDKTLWRLTYETAARAEEILSLDVPDLDLPNKRARVISKGGAGLTALLTGTCRPRARRDGSCASAGPCRARL